VLNDGRVLSLDYCSGLHASGDGRRVVRVPTTCAWSNQEILTYDASDTQWRSTSIETQHFETRNAVDRTARYAVVGGTIYNAQFGLVSGLDFFVTSPLFSADARRLFAFHHDTNSSRQVLHVFDMSGPPVGGRFPKLKEIVMPGVAPSDSVHSIRSILTPDGRSMIKVDSSRFYVFPLPAEVR
jgi:hypothetical protein